MTNITLKSLAMKMHVSVDDLIHWFTELGIDKSDSDYISQQEKDNLLTHISYHAPKNQVLNKLTLQRKVRSTLNVPGSGGKNKQVQIEIRKKHTYIQYRPDTFHEHINCSGFDKDKVSYEVSSIKSDFIFRPKHINSQKLVHKSDVKKSEPPISLSKEKLIFNDKSTSVKKYKKFSQESKLVHHMRDGSDLGIVVSDVVKNNAFNGGMKNVHHYVITRKEGNHSNRKDSDSDRRFRGRQRFRTSRLRNSKVKVVASDKYKKNYDYLFDNKYDNEKLHSVVRSVAKHKNKLSTLIQGFNRPLQMVNRDVIIGETITVSELANRMAVKGSQVVKVMMQLGSVVTINQSIDQQTAQLVAEEMGHHVILRRENDLEEMIMHDRNRSLERSSKIFESRAPVVTVMGHVDHGKTSLLDCVRSTMVASSEAGGITQHIGAYHVKTANNAMITFLDTPGHSAFTAMRARGVQITDIVVLVVAADDGVMLQTIEAIKHVKSVNVPMIVALNKIDKVDTVNIDRIRNELAQHGVISEAWGGETQFVNVSAKLGLGISELLDAILLEAEILELKSIRSGLASGVVLESYLDKGKGPVASVLVREGTLQCGDVILCGLEYGRVRVMHDEMGRSVNTAGPSIPVEVFGLSAPPIAGDLMTVIHDERKAREVALYRKDKSRLVKLERQQKRSNLEHMFANVVSKMGTGLSELNVILKADVQGSVEAIIDSLKILSIDFNIPINIINSGLGGITETDTTLAIATNAILLGFNVRSDIAARRVIEDENINVYYYSVIYDVIDQIKILINNMLIPKQKNKVIAVVEVRNVFRVPRLGSIAGCIVLEGTVHRHNKIRILRKELIVHEGELESLRRFKDDVDEVRSGMECGIGIKNYKDIQSGDFIEVFENI